VAEQDFVEGLGPWLDFAVGFCDFAAVGGEFVVLRDGGSEVFGEFAEGFGEVGGAVFLDSGELVGGGSVGRNFGFDLGNHGAGVEAGVHFHHGNSVLGVVVEQGGLDRAGAASAGEERAVDVDRGDAGEVEDFLGEDFTVGDDDEEIGLERGNLVEKFAAAVGAVGVDFGRGENWGNSEFFGVAGDGIFLEFLAAAGGCGWGGDDADEFEIGVVVELVEEGQGNRRRGAENHAIKNWIVFFGHRGAAAKNSENDFWEGAEEAETCEGLAGVGGAVWFVGADFVAEGGGSSALGGGNRALVDSDRGVGDAGEGVVEARKKFLEGNFARIFLGFLEIFGVFLGNFFGSFLGGVFHWGFFLKKFLKFFLKKI